MDIHVSCAILSAVTVSSLKFYVGKLPPPFPSSLLPPPPLLGELQNGVGVTETREKLSSMSGEEETEGNSS